MSAYKPLTTHDLHSSERRFLAAMQELGYGRFEMLEIRNGELVLDPWPTMIRSIRFGNSTPNRPMETLCEFTLKNEQAEFLGLVRSVSSGVILALEVRGGLPASMEIAERPSPLVPK